MRSPRRATDGSLATFGFLVVATGLASTPTRSLAQATEPPSAPAPAVCSADVSEAARVRFAAAAEPLAELSRTLRVAPGPQPDVRQFMQELRRQIDEDARRVRVLVDELAGVAALGCPEWTIAAHVRQGEAYELFARAIREATLTPLPTELQRRIRGASVTASGGTGPSGLPLQPLFADQVRQVLEAQVRPIECFAITQYLRAARQASAQGIDDAHARTAHARLLAYEDWRIVECVAQDRSLERYAPGELGTLRGHWLPRTSGLAPPPLAP